MDFDWPDTHGKGFPAELGQVLTMRNIATSSQFKSDDPIADLRAFNNFSLRYGGERAFSEDFLQRAADYYTTRRNA